MKPKAASMKKIALLALIALLAATSSFAQARDDDRPLDSTDLRARREGSPLSWPLEVFMDGAAYSWRIHFPSGVDYESSLVAIREGTGPWKLMDDKGRLRSDSASLGLLTLLETSAAAKTYPSEASPLEMGMEEDEAYYFPGWTVNNFQLAKGLSDGSEPFIPLARKRMLEQVLPSPSLLNPKEAVSVMVALKRSGSDTVDGLSITTEAEYIKGERAFFNKEPYRGYSYTAKALALFASTFGTEAGYQEYRDAALAAFAGTSVDWAIFDADPELPLMQKRLITHFLNTVLSGTIWSEGTRIFNGADRPTWFELMYGVNRIPEVAAYIHYAYSVNQPLLVSSLEEAYPEYDYTAFSPISQAEGLELARAALRGYTWGVEYFLPTKESLKPITGNLVYEDNKAAIQAWTAYDESNLNRETNYATTTYPLDLSTVPDAADLPQGWANGLSLDSPFASGKAGSPLPFARGGKASPRDFARAMMAASATQRAMKFTLPPEGEGLDALGLLTSALAQTSLMGRVESLEDDFPAASLDEYYRTGQTPTAPVRFLREDIEKLSLLLPDISRIQVGDLLVHYGEEEGQSKDSFKLGIVLHAPVAGRPLPGQDGSAYFKQVVVLGVNEGERQVGLYTWLSNGTSRGFSEKPEGWQLRRLFAKPAPVTLLKSQTMGIMRSFGAEGIVVALSSGDAGVATQTLLDTAITDIVFTFGKSYDHSSQSTGAPQNQRWIPNTGQYLVLEDLRVTPKTDKKASLDLEKALGKNYVVVLGMVDRNFSVLPVAEANITRNKGDGFELVAVPQKGLDRAEALPLFNFSRKIDDEPEQMAQYAIRDSSLYADENQTSYKDGFDLFIKNGKLQALYSIGSYKVAVGSDKFAIRPYATNIWPGDDLVLQISIKLIRKTGPVVYTKTMDEINYLAVYDKKMLWRSNLYIDEGGADWNNLHPWNAPPDPTAYAAMSQFDKNMMKWWSESWGYNEWNRVHNGKDDFRGLLDLDPGNGKQNIFLSVFTPTRTLPSTAENKANALNKLTGTVAYSYPNHIAEPINAGTSWPHGSAGSMDSPFDFNKKMVRQMLQQKKSESNGNNDDWKLWVSDTGYRFKKRRDTWPAKPQDGAEIDRFTSVTQFDENVGLPKGITIADVIAFEGNWKDFQFQDSSSPVKNIKLREISLAQPDSSIYSTTAIGNSWWMYSDRKPSSTWASGIDNPNTWSFIPSLGLTYATRKGLFSTDYDENRPQGLKDQKDNFLDDDYVIEAGTDCVGFAQRAASWNGNEYQWTNLNKGWTENPNQYGTDSIWQQLETYTHDATGGRSYANSDAAATNIIHNRSGTPGNYFNTSQAAIAEMTNIQKMALLAQLRMIIPGDIWVKDSGDAGADWDNHIAIVASVPADPHAISDPIVYMEQLVLIEGEFANRIQSVIKKLNVWDYNAGNISLAFKIYSNFTTPNVGAAISLNCQSWAIRRLK